MIKMKKPNEVAEVLNVGIRTVYALIRQGKLKALRIGRKLRILEANLEEFLNEQL